MSFFDPDPARHARLIHLSPAAIARLLLDGEFTIGDEPALMFSLRKDPRITLDDDAIMDVLFEVIAEGEDIDPRYPGDHIASEVLLDRLADASRPRRSSR